MEKHPSLYEDLAPGPGNLLPELSNKSTTRESGEDVIDLPATVDNDSQIQKDDTDDSTNEPTVPRVCHDHGDERSSYTQNRFAGLLDCLRILMDDKATTEDRTAAARVLVAQLPTIKTPLLGLVHQLPLAMQVDARALLELSGGGEEGNSGVETVLRFVTKHRDFLTPFHRLTDICPLLKPEDTWEALGCFFQIALCYSTTNETNTTPEVRKKRKINNNRYDACAGRPLLPGAMSPWAASAVACRQGTGVAAVRH